MSPAFRFTSDTNSSHFHDAMDTIGARYTVEGTDVEVEEDSAEVCSPKRAKRAHDGQD
jgi:hypothetical protein